MKQKWRKFVVELILCLALLALLVMVAYFGYTLIFGEVGEQMADHINSMINSIIP